MMNVVLGYHYATGKWGLIDVSFGPLSVKADVYKRCQTDGSIYTEIIDAPIKDGVITGENLEVNLADGFELPAVLTLEESIKKNKKILTDYCA